MQSDKKQRMKTARTGVFITDISTSNVEQGASDLPQVQYYYTVLKRVHYLVIVANGV
jgi:hypothetical protein